MGVFRTIGGGCNRSPVVSDCSIERYIRSFPQGYSYHLKILTAEIEQDFYDQDSLPPNFRLSGSLDELGKSLESLPNPSDITITIEGNIEISSHDGGDLITKYPAQDVRVLKAVGDLFEDSGFYFKDIFQFLKTKPCLYLRFDRPGTLAETFSSFHEVINHRNP